MTEQQKPESEQNQQNERALLTQKLNEQVAMIKQLTQKCEFTFGSGDGAMFVDIGHQSQRNTLVPVFANNVKLSHGPPTTLVIDPPSSGVEYKKPPTFKEVVERLFDPNIHLQFVQQLSEIPNGIIPFLLISNIDANYTAKHLKDKLDLFLEHTQQRSESLQPESVRIFSTHQIPGNMTKTAALIQYSTMDQVQKVFDTLQSNIINLINSQQQQFKIFYAYDKRRVVEERWVGVVLRNLPPDCMQEMVRKNFTKSDTGETFNVIQAEVPLMIKGQKCGIIQLPDIEEAEKFCAKWNVFRFNQFKKLEAHIHPFSNPYRANPEKSHHQIFVSQAKKESKNGNLFENHVKMPTFSTQLDAQRKNKQQQIQQIQPSTTIQTVKEISSVEKQSNNLQEMLINLQNISQQQQPIQVIQASINSVNQQSKTIESVPTQYPQKVQNSHHQNAMTNFVQNNQPKEICLQTLSQEHENQQRIKKEQELRKQQEMMKQQEQQDQQTISVNVTQQQSNPFILNLSEASEALLSIAKQYEPMQPKTQKPQNSQQKPVPKNEPDYLNDILSGVTNPKPTKRGKSTKNPSDVQSNQPHSSQISTNLSSTIVSTVKDPSNIQVTSKKEQQQQQQQQIQDIATDTKESSSEDKLLGKRKIKEISKRESNENTKQSQKRALENSDARVSDDDGDEDYEDYQESSYEVRSRGRKRRLRKIVESDDEETMYDPSKLRLEHSSSSNSNVQPRRRGRPPKKRGRKPRDQSSSTRNSVYNQQQQLGDVKESDSSLSLSQLQQQDPTQIPVKKSRGRPPKKQTNANQS